MSVRHISLAKILTTKVCVLCSERPPDQPALKGVGKLLTFSLARSIKLSRA